MVFSVHHRNEFCCEISSLSVNVSQQEQGSSSRTRSMHDAVQGSLVRLAWSQLEASRPFLTSGRAWDSPHNDQ